MSSSGTDTDPAAPGREAEEAGGTVVSVEMPKMGISVSEGTILEWRKQPGDWVEADETIADVTTDKVDVEIPAPASGRVTKLIVEAGETVDVGTAIAEIDADASPGQAHPDEDRPDTADTEKAEPESDRSGFISPVVRRIADKHDVDLEQVEGTGIGGRIRKKDVLEHVRAGSSASRPGPARPVEAGNGHEKPAPVLHSESPYRPDEPEAPPTDGLRREPMSPMRQAIAKHMLESRRTSAHCTTIVEVDMAKVAERRKQLGTTYLAFVARATVASLAEFPSLNASIEGDEIVYHDDVNLGIAVALDDGLIVPVIPKAQRLSVQGLAESIVDFAERARSKRLDPDEVHGGTFTITNPGQFGAVLATPIINQPQVAILDLEAIVKRPVVITDESGNDSIAIRPMTYLCMSWDHRALDGAVAAKFLSAVKGRLEAGGEL
jgi:pyruvate/2-oxoglutarate dehydrogenase complex dihydrolipoamide acyltransferase (E2) component